MKVLLLCLLVYFDLLLVHADPLIVDGMLPSSPIHFLYFIIIIILGSILERRFDGIGGLSGGGATSRYYY